MHAQRTAALYLLPIVCLVVGVWACEFEQLQRGCKIQTSKCICGFGCKSEYRYSSNSECREALKERGSDICSRKPCFNNGLCVQVSQEPRFKCLCGGTGFFGDRCEKRCPTKPQAMPFPTECIVI